MTPNACFAISAFETFVLVSGFISALFLIPYILFIIGDVIFSKGRKFLSISKAMGIIYAAVYAVFVIWFLLAEYVL